MEDFVLVSAYGANPNSKIFYSRMKGELEEEVKSFILIKLPFSNLECSIEKTDRTGEVLGARIIKFANKFILESQKPLPTDILAQALVNSSKIKSYGYSKIKLASIFSFAEKGKE